MKVTVHGHHIDVGEAFETHITDRLEAINEKYFGRATNVVVTIEKETKSLIKAYISLTMGKDIQVQATAKTHDPYGAFDEAAEKIAKQLRRYKRKLRDHHEQMEQAEFMKVAEFAFKSSLQAEQLDHLTDEEIESQDEPVIIAEMTTNIQTMAVSDAVMRLNLSGNNAMMFRNSKNGGLNMVYVRQDGNIGWVDPQAVEQTISKTEVA
jgi:ribosomal subunit interface protein